MIRQVPLRQPTVNVIVLRRARGARMSRARAAAGRVCAGAALPLGARRARAAARGRRGRRCLRVREVVRQHGAAELEAVDGGGHERAALVQPAAVGGILARGSSRLDVRPDRRSSATLCSEKRLPSPTSGSDCGMPASRWNLTQSTSCPPTVPAGTARWSSRVRAQQRVRRVAGHQAAEGVVGGQRLRQAERHVALEQRLRALDPLGGGLARCWRGSVAEGQRLRRRRAGP